jgi:hypothetical protein
MLLDVPAYAAAVPIELLWDEAPRTCAAVWAELPIVKPAFHGRRSGQELFVLADEFASVPGPENSTNRVRAGDVAFLHLPPTWTDRHEQFTVSASGIFDIAFIYGPDALLRAPEGPVESNIFGRVVGPPLEDLAGVCDRMWREGARDVRLARTGGE